MKSVRNFLRWPAKPGNGMAPWFVILWRCVWFLPIVGSVALATLFICISRGPDTARQFWMDAV